MTELFVEEAHPSHVLDDWTTSEGDTVIECANCGQVVMRNGVPFVASRPCGFTE